MTQNLAEQFACESCGKFFRWKPQLAGKKVKCPCGHIMLVPAAIVPEDDLYEFAESAPLPVEKITASPSSPQHVLPIEYHQPKTGRAVESDDYFPDRAKDLYFPLALIGGGLIIQFTYAAFFSPQTVIGGSLRAMLEVGRDMVLSTVLMLVAILIVARVRKINIGQLPVAMMKLCAVAIAPGAVALLLAPLAMFIPLIGGLGIWAAQFILFFALLGALFDLDESDTWYCVCIMFLVNLAFYFGMKWIS
jgi:hypothetical protein